MAEDHVTVSNVAGGHLLTCAHCGQTETVALPMEWRKWSAVTRRFQKQHRTCPPPTDGTAGARPMDTRPNMSYTHVRVKTLSGGVEGRIKALIVEDPDGGLRFLQGVMDAAAVAIMTGRALAGHEGEPAFTGPFPYFQVVADENRAGGSEVTFPLVALEDGLTLQPTRADGWWYANRGFRAVSFPQPTDGKEIHPQ